MNEGQFIDGPPSFAVARGEFGLPQVIRTDNGVPFASAHARYGLSKLAVWWLRLGIQIERIKGSTSLHGQISVCRQPLAELGQPVLTYHNLAIRCPRIIARQHPKSPPGAISTVRGNSSTGE